MEVTGEFLLWLSLYGYFMSGTELLALLLSVSVHEYGHILAIWLQGSRLRRVRLGGFGVRLDADGAETPREAALRFLSGPLAGTLLCLVLRSFGGVFSEMCFVCSRTLTLMNLMPVSCLDGGGAVRVLLRSTVPAYAETLMRLLHLLTALVCLLTGAGRPELILWAAVILLTSFWEKRKNECLR